MREVEAAGPAEPEARSEGDAGPGGRFDLGPTSLLVFGVALASRFGLRLTGPPN